VSFPHPCFFMAFLFEALPFDLTFKILFGYGGFDSLETVLGRHTCWEFLKLMKNSKRAELLCICRAVQLLDHPAHALFLLNYPPDSSIPENRCAWAIAVKCCIGWNPDIRSVVLAMRAFMPSARQHVFPWLNLADLARIRCEEEWKFIGEQQRVGYKFNEWWWNGQREAFHLERGAARSQMGVVIECRAMEEMEKLEGAIKRIETREVVEAKECRRWKRIQKEKLEAAIRAQNKASPPMTSEEKKEECVELPPKPIVLTSEDKKKIAESTKVQLKIIKTLHDSVKQALGKKKIPKNKIRVAAKLIVSLGRQNKLIKWSLYNMLHTTVDLNVWGLEFVLHSIHWTGANEENALEKLKAL
jgi:hypothetical protein